PLYRLLHLFVIHTGSHFLSLLFHHATPPTEIYSLSLHDALPISPCRSATGCSTCSRSTRCGRVGPRAPIRCCGSCWLPSVARSGDRKSTRLDSSHVKISYAVFCLKKKIEGE